MPTILESTRSQPQAGEVELLHPETNDLTMEAQVMVDFLTRVDFSPVCAVEGIEDLCVDGTVESLDEEDKTEKAKLLPMDVVYDVVDEDDLEEMFADFIGRQADEVEAAGDAATLESKARLAPFSDLLAERRGMAKKVAKKSAGFLKNRRRFLAMRIKGVIKHVKAGTGYGGGTWTKDKGYKTGGTPAGKRKYQLWLAKNKAKSKRSARAAKEKVKESFELDATPVFGLGVPFETTDGKVANYVATVREDAAQIIAERKKKGGMKGAPKAPMPKHQGSAGACEGDEDGPAGARYTVCESASLAAQVLPLMESRQATQTTQTTQTT